jgi:histidinol-phosphate aminotransferase
MSIDSINLQFTTIKDPLPDFIYDGLNKYSSGANAYKPQPVELVEKLAEKHLIPKEMIYLTAGIDEAIQMFAMAYGQNAFCFTPTYVVISDVEEFGGKLTRVYSIENSEFKVKTDSIPEATLIYLANPNNPSGITLKEQVMELVKNNSQAKVVIDEAYGEFADQSVIDQIKDNPHMTVFRSFSKAYGMAGNRIGYIIAHPEVINVVKNKTQWSNVSYLSVGAAMTALEHEDYFKQIREDIGKRRDDFIEFLQNSNFSVLPSKINAMLLKFSSDKEGTKFAQYLTQNNFVISHGNGNSNIGLDKSFVRIAIGNANQMQILKKVIEKYE